MPPTQTIVTAINNFFILVLKVSDKVDLYEVPL
jgi:hypothetical protein